MLDMLINKSADSGQFSVLRAGTNHGDGDRCSLDVNGPVLPRETKCRIRCGHVTSRYTPAIFVTLSADSAFAVLANL